MKPKWKVGEGTDYESAERYLSLRFTPAEAKRLVRRLKRGKIQMVRVNDVLRAFNREPLPRTDPGVRATLQKIADGKPLHPPLLVSFDDGGDVADGYHRISAIYWLPDGPFTEIPAKVVYKS